MPPRSAAASAVTGLGRGAVLPRSAPAAARASSSFATRSGTGSVAGFSRRLRRVASVVPSLISTPDLPQLFESLRGLFDVLTFGSSGTAPPAQPRRSRCRRGQTGWQHRPRRRSSAPAAAMDDRLRRLQRDRAQHRALGGRAQLPGIVEGRQDLRHRQARPPVPAASARASTSGTSASRFGNTAFGEIRGGSMMRNSAMLAWLSTSSAIDADSRRVDQLVVVLAQHVVVAVQLRHLGFDLRRASGDRLELRQARLALADARTQGRDVGLGVGEGNLDLLEDRIGGRGERRRILRGRLAARFELLLLLFFERRDQPLRRDARPDAGRCSDASVRRAASSGRRCARRTRRLAGRRPPMPCRAEAPDPRRPVRA